MNVALSILGGLATTAACLFVVFSFCVLFLRPLSDTKEWWGAPLFLALGLCAVLPGILASFVLGGVTAFLIHALVFQ